MPEIRKATKLSPLHHPLTRAGAALAEISGWLVAENFGDARAEAAAVRSRVGLSDRSAVPKFEIQGKELERALGSVFGAAAPAPGRAALAQGGYVCRLSSNHALVILDDVHSSQPAWLGSGDFAAGCVHVVERTNGYGGLLLCGPAAPHVLRKLSSLDIREEKFPDLGCAAGPLASIRAVLVRKDRVGFPGFEIFFSREYGEYLWDVVCQAGTEFEIRPFGLAAAKLL